MKRTEYSRFFLIAADHSRMHMIQKLPEFSPAKRTSAHTDRIENNRMTKLIGTFPGKDARRILASSGTPVFRRFPDRK